MPVTVPPSSVPSSEKLDRHVSGRRFHLIHRVGAGAFGEVFLAEQDSGAGFRRKVALKLLHGDAATQHDAGTRFRDEARILGRLTHRNIVTVLDLVKLGDRWAVVMDYIPGADLQQVVKATRVIGETVPVPAALEVGASILSALDAAWNADDERGGTLRVIHRDIKPPNVRLTRDGEVKVLDFGVAQVNLDTREAQTRTNGWIGTERYMSPERILCEGDLPAGDVYSAAVTALELLLGRPLGRTPVLPDRHAAWIEEALAVIRPQIEAPPEVIEAVLAAFREGLADDPNARPTAGALSDRMRDLSRQVRGESLIAFAKRVVPRVGEILAIETVAANGILAESGASELADAASATSGAGSLLGGTSASPPGGRSPVLPLLAVVAGMLGMGSMLAVAAGIAWFALPGRKHLEPPPAAPVAAATLPAPAPVALPEPPAPAPETPAPTPTIAPAAAPALEARRPAPAKEPPPPPVVAPPAPRIERALVAASNASSLEVTCGDVHGSGTTSAVIRNFPGGTCRVDVNLGGATKSATVVIDRPREVRCTLGDDGALLCP